MEQNVKTLLEQFRTIAANPKKAVEDHKAETGKGAIGMMPVYAPKRWSTPTGFLPVGLWGGNRPVSKARTLSASLCLLHHAAGYGAGVRRRL